MAGTRITQARCALPGRRYGSFAGKAEAPASQGHGTFVPAPRPARFAWLADRLRRPRQRPQVRLPDVTPDRVAVLRQARRRRQARTLLLLALAECDI